MDKVTQQNAANAEESASASEELSAQAASMNEAVQDLVALVGGNVSNSMHFGHGEAGNSRSLSTTDRTFHQIAAGSEKGAKSKATVAIKSNSVTVHGFDSR